MTLVATRYLRARSSSAAPSSGGRARCAFGGRAVGQHHGAVEGHLQQEGVELVAVLQVALVLAVLDLVQRRLRDVDVAALHQHRHLPVEEGQQQRADVRAVHVGVGHDDDAVVAQLVDVEVVAVPADAGAQRGDQRDDLSLLSSLS
jgi:uncharacterized membrane protein